MSSGVGARCVMKSGVCVLELHEPCHIARFNLGESVWVQDAEEWSECSPGARESSEVIRLDFERGEVHVSPAVKTSEVAYVFKRPSEDELDRQEFIRDAAVAISSAQGRYGGGVWADAVALWECKPDDC